MVGLTQPEVLLVAVGNVSDASADVDVDVAVLDSGVDVRAGSG